MKKIIYWLTLAVAAYVDAMERTYRDCGNNGTDFFYPRIWP